MTTGVSCPHVGTIPAQLLFIVMPWVTASAAQEHACAEWVLSSFDRTDHHWESENKELYESQLIDLVHGHIRRTLEPEVEIVQESYTVGASSEWSDNSELSDGAILQPGIDWKTATTPQSAGFSGQLVIVGNGPMEPAVVEDRVVVIWQTGPSRPRDADIHDTVTPRRREAERAGASAVIVVLSQTQSPDDSIHGIRRTFLVEDGIPAVYVSRKTLGDWISSEGIEPDDLPAEPGDPPVFLSRVVRGRVGSERPATQSRQVVATIPGRGQHATERVVLLLQADWYSRTDGQGWSHPDSSSTGFASTLCALAALSDLAERRTLTVAVGYQSMYAAAYMPAQHTAGTTRAVSVSQTGHLANAGLEVTHTHHSDWVRRLESALEPSHVPWTTRRGLYWDHNPMFAVPHTPMLSLHTPEPSDSTPMDIDGMRTMTDVTQRLILDLVTSENP